MSILIRGMKLPYRCCECKLKYWDGEEDICPFVGIIVSIGRHDACPLVQVPPHGRLIDESDVLKSAEELQQSPWYRNKHLHAIRKDAFEIAIDLTVKDAPTIIEAEEGE